MAFFDELIDLEENYIQQNSQQTKITIMLIVIKDCTKRSTGKNLRSGNKME